MLFLTESSLYASDLLTHDRFADRNKRMLADGFTNAGWVSVDVAGEALGCRRADTVIALQDFEATEFRSLIGPGSDVRQSDLFRRVHLSCIHLKRSD